MIDENRIRELKEIVRDEHGIELDDETARVLAESTIAAMKVILRPIPQNNTIVQ